MLSAFIFSTKSKHSRGVAAARTLLFVHGNVNTTGRYARPRAAKSQIWRLQRCSLLWDLVALPALYNTHGSRWTMMRLCETSSTRNFYLEAPGRARWRNMEESDEVCIVREYSEILRPMLRPKSFQVVERPFFLFNVAHDRYLVLVQRCNNYLA